jgi:catechol 2,3-dioxygenase-like lactoylglutathione lyase family enzyme
VLRVTGLDHVVIVTPDVERQLAFRTGVLGCPGERVDEWRRGEVPFPSVRLDATTIVDLLRGERTGTNVDHVALVVQLDDGDDLLSFAEGAGLPVLGPPRQLFGALGVGTGLYVRDPDGGVLELRTYG